MSIDPPLDDEQRAVVDAQDSVLAVLAGPGSGKTRVLSYRARRLLMLHPNAKALLVTFTNKAAAEMKARALGVALVRSDRILACTFHTFGMRVLHAHGDLVAVGRDFQVMEDEEMVGLAKEAASAAGVPDQSRSWSYMRLRRRSISNAKLLAFGRSYEAAKRARHLVDFDDLIVYTADLLEMYPQVAEAYATGYPHLLVDEFQDSNSAQFAVVRALSRYSETVSVFADDDQAIYRFAGAEAENVTRFIQELGARVYPLTVNYRSRQRIVACADLLLEADPRTSGRRMTAVRKGGEVRCLSFSNVGQEAATLADEIADIVGRGGVRPYDIAVLARSGFRLRDLMVEVERRGVPVTSWLGESYEVTARRVLRICLSVVAGTLNDRQARQLCEFLGVELGDDRDPVTLLEGCADIPAAAALIELRERVWRGAPLVEVVRQAQAAALCSDTNLGVVLEPMVDDVATFVRYDPEFSLDHLLAELALGSVAGAPTIGGGVKFASLHRTKGLQWPQVYLVGMEEDRLPDYRAKTDEALSEERRACFVGICRAEDRLTFTRVESDRGWQQRPSRFLFEMNLLRR